MTRPQRMRMGRGFSLIEVLVAVALVTALVGTMFGFLRNVIDSRQRVLARTATQRAAMILIDRLEADLQTCLVGDAAYGSGVSGDGSSISLLTRGVGLSLVDRGKGDAAALGDLQRVEYRFDPRRREVEARRVAANVPAAEPAAAELLGGTIHKLRFRYHDGSTWRDSFDALTEDRLPAAIEVAMWFNPWPGESAADESDAEMGSASAKSPGAGKEEDRAADRRDDPASREALDEPAPDRIRVIVIPDSAADDAPSSSPAPKTAGGSP